MPKKLLLLPPLSASAAFRLPRPRPAARLAMNAARTGYRVFSANSTAACTELAKRITERLGAELGKSAVYQETNGETRVEIKESVRGQDIFIIQTIPRDIDYSPPGALHHRCCPPLEVFITLSRNSAPCSCNIAAGEFKLPTFQLAAERLTTVPPGLLALPLPPKSFLVMAAKWKVRDVNTAVMELLIMAYALKTACARNIIGVIPYFPYSKQSKMRKRGSIVCKLLASMLAKAGLTHIITMDLHQKEIQGFFSFPVDNLRASPFLLQYIQEEIPNYRNAVIVAKSPDAAKRAQSYAERLRLGLAVIHGEAQCTELDMDDGRHSPPMVRNATVHPGLELPLMMAKEKPPITVVGDVGGRIAIIVDDIIDDVESFVAAAEILKERGAYKIYVMATHGILSAEAPRLIEESSVDEVVVTNTVPHEVQKLQCPKIKTVDISLILSEAIRRIHNGESMSYLFRNITVDD
ncbi:phosphoribosyl pyrophosphate synthase-associated protein 1 isoform 1-T1 [Trichechus inunguis]